jgi:hypothetical protein
MLQHIKLILFTAAITSASFSQPGGLGYGAAVQTTAAVMQATARLIAKWRRRSGRSGNRLDLRRLARTPCSARRLTIREHHHA